MVYLADGAMSLVYNVTLQTRATLHAVGVVVEGRGPTVRSSRACTSSCSIPASSVCRALGCGPSAFGHREHIDVIHAKHAQVDEFMEREGRCPAEREVPEPWESGGLYIRCAEGFHEVGINIGFDDAVWVRHSHAGKCWRFEECEST